MLHQLDDIESDRVSQDEQFDDVDAPLAGFGLCYPRLKVAHTAGEFALIEFCRGSFFRQKLHQVAVQFGVNRPHSTECLSNYRIIPNPDQTAIFLPISTICKGTIVARRDQPAQLGIVAHVVRGVIMFVYWRERSPSYEHVNDLRKQEPQPKRRRALEPKP
jgi:hypothetical protein